MQRFHKRFSPEEVERARRYHRPRYVALAADLALGLATLALLALTAVGDRLFGVLGPLPWWGRALAFPALVVAVSTAARLPLSVWSGYLHEKRWNFSTQSLGAWAADRLKSFAVGVTLTALPLFGLVALARALPHAWPLAAAAGAAALVLVLSLAGPVVLEPLFNRFSTLADPALAAELRDLAERAEVPVREVLVADASRRTRKENAYVSGLGRTRRVVLYDTLLERAGPPELRLVVTHELGHRRMRHVAKGTALAMAGTAAAVLVLWALVPEPESPRSAPLVLLVAALLEFAAAPAGAALSRRWERAADRFSLELTGDRETYVATHRALALANLADLDPPRALYLLLFTHPTPPERIAAAGAVPRSSSPDAGGARE